MKLKGHIWFSGRATIGIVLIENEMGEEKAYIGVGGGYDEEADLKLIMEWGTTFPLDAAKILIL